MKVTQFSSFLENIPPQIKGFLIYGNNENLVYFREKVIIRHLKKANPSLQICFLEDFIIPETSSLSLFETKPSSVVYVYRRANDRLLKEIEKVINQGSHYYILTNPNLTSKAKLVDFALKHPSVVAIPSYTVEMSEITKVVNDFCEETSLNLSAETKKIIIESLMANPLMFESQLQKLALLSANGSFSSADLQELFILKEESDLFKMKEAFFKGDCITFTQAWNILKRDEAQDISLLRFLQAEAFRSLKGSEGAYYKSTLLPPLQASRLLLLLLDLETVVKWQSNLPENYLLQRLLQWLPANSLATR